jgi:hypothetical protein
MSFIYIYINDICSSFKYIYIYVLRNYATLAHNIFQSFLHSYGLQFLSEQRYRLKYFELFKDIPELMIELNLHEMDIGALYFFPCAK